jgi:outer membrane lipoprotein SlyB
MRSHSIFLLTAILSAVSFSGCATNSSVSKVKDEARDAHRVAEQALTTAQEANSRSIRTEEMVNRSFRHSMRK